MAVIKFGNGRFFEQKSGYNLLYPLTIQRYYEHARGIGTTDAYVVIHYHDGKVEELMRGKIPPRTGEQKAFYEIQEKILKKLSNDAENAYSASKVDKYFVGTWNLEPGLAGVFVGCKDGVIGAGWYDSTKTKQKALKMSAFILYGLGYINSDTDNTLWETTYSCLPFSVDLGRTDVADEIIDKSLKEVRAQQLTAAK